MNKTENKTENKEIQQTEPVKSATLASIEILKFDDKEVLENMENMSEENFEIIYNTNLITRYIPVTDLHDKYVLRISTLKENSNFKVLDPNEVNPMDQFELSESTAAILTKLGIKAAPLKSEEDMQIDAFEAGKEKLKEIQRKMKEKIIAAKEKVKEELGAVNEKLKESD